MEFLFFHTEAILKGPLFLAFESQWGVYSMEVHQPLLPHPLILMVNVAGSPWFLGVPFS